MFCKWCGGNIASSDTKCKRCGREVPALSDCGGFYDLVPNAKKTADVQPGPVVRPEKPETPPVNPESTKETGSAGRNKNGGKLLLGLAVLIVLGFALVISMLVNINGKVDQCLNEVNRLQGDLRTVSEKMDSFEETFGLIATELESTEPETEPEVTEPVVVADPVLAEQNVSFTVKIAGKDSERKIEAGLDLGEYIDTAIISYDLDEQTNAVKTINYTLKEADAAVLLTIDRYDERHTRNLSVSYVIDDNAYGFSEASETCRWQYRCGNDASWEDLLTDTFTQTNEAGITGLSIKDTALQELISNNEGELELRCEISRINTENGSLTIVIEGIRFYEVANNDKTAVG